MTTLSKAITGRREKLGMTQHDLAEAIGISHRKVSRFEQGKAIPSPITREKLSKALGIDPDVIEILSGHVPADLMRKWQNDPERAAKWMREGFAAEHAVKVCPVPPIFWLEGI